VGKIKRLKVTIRALLELLDEMGEIPYKYSKSAMWRNAYLSDWQKRYYPSGIEEIAGKLLRKGLVEKIQKNGETVIVINEKGKRHRLSYELVKLTKKSGKWDGKWRMVIFDIDEKRKKKRDYLRYYLEKLGFRQMQKSVWVSPFDCENEIKYIREILEVPHEVKIGVLERIENDEDLREWFDV
jgi:hypothetical protein